MRYKLVNPLEVTTFEAASREVALAVCGLLGNGHYGILEIDDNGNTNGPGEGINYIAPTPEHFRDLTGIEVEDAWANYDDMIASFKSIAGAPIIREVADKVTAVFELLKSLQPKVAIEVTCGVG